MKVADFFCGAGGFSEGFRQAGFEIVFAVDKWLPAINTYKANKPTVNAIIDDVVRIAHLSDEEFERQVPDTEVIIGSPPCVAFSNSNKSGKGDKSVGILLLESYLRIIARKKFKKNSILKYWVLENVPNIQKYVKSEYTANDLGLEGDFILCPISESTGVYNAKYFGAPTNRRRFLCGEFPILTETHNDSNLLTLQHVFESLGEPCLEDRKFIEDCNYKSLILPKDEVTDHQYKHLVPEFEWKTAERLKLDRGYMGKMSFPENSCKPARTVMATITASSRESMILNNAQGGFRLPTVREAACMMSFPIDYRFYGNSEGVKYKLVGNAVPPKLSFAVASAILKDNDFTVPSEYPRITHNDEIRFVNLNYSEILTKEEKPKRMDAKFKYHIPFLIRKAYRVELTNHHSDFRANRITWIAEIHFSQGKTKASVLSPKIELNDFITEYQSKIENFINKIVEAISTHDELQKNYCMTSNEKQGRIGPFELLQQVKNFINENFNSENNYMKSPMNMKMIAIPQEILVGYYILRSITSKMGGKSNGT